MEGESGPCQAAELIIGTASGLMHAQDPRSQGEQLGPIPFPQQLDTLSGFGGQWWYTGAEFRPAYVALATQYIADFADVPPLAQPNEYFNISGIYRGRLGLSQAEGLTIL